VFYKKAKAKFDADPEFKKRSQKAVVSLQGGEEKYVLAWRQICNISRREFNVVYERLHVTLEEKVCLLTWHHFMTAENCFCFIRKLSVSKF
jgi:arginyl-tRNA synthetase